MSPICPPQFGATAHWTFCSYGRLEAKRVSQFWKKFGTQQHVRTRMTVTWINIKIFKIKTADGRHVGKYSKCHNSPINGPTGTEVGCSHPIMSPTCPPSCGCHGNGRSLATTHCTLGSYGRLETERVNQFWWNLVSKRKLGPQWQSRDQILKFLKFKMADGRHVGKY